MNYKTTTFNLGKRVLKVIKFGWLEKVLTKFHLEKERQMRTKKIATVIDVARAASCSSHVVRTLVDRNLIDCTRDYNNWRRFPNLKKSVEEAKQVLEEDHTQIWPDVNSQEEASLRSGS